MNKFYVQGEQYPGNRGGNFQVDMNLQHTGPEKKFSNNATRYFFLCNEGPVKSTLDIRKQDFIYVIDPSWPINGAL